MKSRKWFLFLGVLVFGLVGCGWFTPTEPEKSDITITGDNNDVTVTDTSGDGNDVSVDEGGCCDDAAGQCYSIPSGSQRSCEGCTIGVNCTLDPNDPRIEGNEEE